MNKTVGIILLIIVIGIGAFFYLTRPVATPMQSETTSEKLPAGTTPTPGTTYRMGSSNSTAKFSIDEKLSGKPFTAVGTTQNVMGDVVIVDQEGGSGMTIGKITIDARTFKTDSSNRDGAINRFILKTTEEANAYITFTPTKITGLPTVIPMNAPFSFSVSGNLTISGITKPATFSVTATRGETTLTGAATSTLKRTDYSLTIPSIPFVANVSDAFRVELDFAAGKILQ